MRRRCVTCLIDTPSCGSRASGPRPARGGSCTWSNEHGATLPQTERLVARPSFVALQNEQMSCGELHRRHRSGRSREVSSPPYAAHADIRHLRRQAIPMTQDTRARALQVNAERREVFMFRPHVVILGAGASRAALANGDANGRILPLMANLLQVIPSIRGLLLEAGLEIDDSDFESTYGRIAKDDAYGAVTSRIETAIL